MLTRIITSLVGLAVFFGLLFAGEIPFNCAVALVIAVMLYEMYRTIKAHRVLWVVGYLGGALLLFSAMSQMIATGTAVVFVIAAFMIAAVFLHGRVPFLDVCASGFTTLFITLFMGSVMELRSQFGVCAVLLVFICAWTTDTFAYFAGCFLGRHKLIPHVSPKKTVEGAVGGVVGCMLSCMLYLFILNRIPGVEIPGMSRHVQFMLLGAVASVLSQLGDLSASAIKRDFNIKDFGHILPGHGGILDRFDSVVFIAPFIYFLMQLLVKM